MIYELTEHFNSNEFDCRDKTITPMHVRANIQHLATALETIHNFYAKPILVHSGYRSASYNNVVGGSSKSFHLLGKAADISIEGVEPRALARLLAFCMQMNIIPTGGLGIYKTFVHYDTRGYFVTWKG
tara:strand:- start:747 stop:1130 length:384 start_codon:yes stop_codon:yes gene_type:complete